MAGGSGQDALGFTSEPNVVPMIDILLVLLIIFMMPRRVAMFSVHSCPLAALGGRETGGMNVYVRELSRHLGQQGIAVDVYTRRQDPCMPTVVDFAPQARVIHLNAGPPAPYTKYRVLDHLPEFLERVQGFMATHGLGYDLLHSHYWLSGRVALQLRQALRLPMVQFAEHFRPGFRVSKQRRRRARDR